MNYLYNGVELPALPRVDGRSLAYIAKVGAYYSLYISSIPFYVKDSGHCATADTTTVSHFIKPDYSDEWSGESEIEISPESMAHTPIWANYDMLSEDGTLYLAASEPIPVGTAPQLDPLSLWLGWKAGNWVARQRGKA